MLNNTIVSNEHDINRSNLVNDVLNNGKFYPISNHQKLFLYQLINLLQKIIMLHLIQKKHEITFTIPICLKDISNFFKNIGLINFGEFNINLSLLDEIISSSREIKMLI